MGKAKTKVKNGYILEEVRLGIREPERLFSEDAQEESEHHSETLSESSADTTDITSESPAAVE